MVVQGAALLESGDRRFVTAACDGACSRTRGGDRGGGWQQLRVAGGLGLGGLGRLGFQLGLWAGEFVIDFGLLGNVLGIWVRAG
ncbi:hypothetical protein V6N13_109658 [Hibiscus sabdariffa]